MNNPRLIVFDWDQTLWNSWDLHLQCMWHAADALGLPRPSAEIIAPRYSMPFIDHVTSLFQDDTETVLEIYMEFYVSRMTDLGHLYEGIADAVTSLKRQGYSLAVFSDKRRAYGEPEAEYCGLVSLFDTVLFREEGRPHKPDPQGLHQILASLGVPVQDALVVGDSHVDMECARNAGVTSAAALWGSVNRQATLDQQPDYIWNTVEDMESALLT